MKKAILAALVATLVMGAFCLGRATSTKPKETSKPSNSYYPLTMVVRELNYETNTLVLVDGAGNKWAIATDIDDWLTGDVCSCIMNDKGTTTIYDDEIVEFRYGGYYDFFKEGIK